MGLPPTCQSVVNAIVSGPQPQDRRRQCGHLCQTLLRHVLKVLSTRPAAKEVVDVAPHCTQHLLGIWEENNMNTEYQ